MDAVPVPGNGSGAGPAPFLIKTYEMVDDSSTDEIVSWSSSNNSFVVWNPPEFARLLLPSYFKHNNFSSFIRQLNTYGFRKSDPEKWEFSNEDFMKDQKHLLKNIHRRKPVHSHSHPQGSSSIDPERAAFDEEIEKLSREKTSLEADCSRFKQHCSTAKLRLEDLTQQVAGLELRQDNVLMFLEKSIQNQTFIQHLAHKFEAMDFSAYNKKRRLPEIEHSQQVLDNSSADEQSSGNAFHQDFSNKLNLELSPAVSNINRSSLKFRSYSSLSQMAVANESMMPWPLREGLPAVEESDDRVSCHLNLTLASSQLQLGQEARESVVKEAELTDSSFSSEVQGLAQKLPAAPTRVNDVFWEQFLTERPGSSDTDDASSQYGVNSYDPEDRKPTFGVSGNTKNMEQLTL